MRRALSALIGKNMQSMYEKCFGIPQMGGAEGVRKAEQYTLVVGLNRGMMMHAVPRELA